MTKQYDAHQVVDAMQVAGQVATAIESFRRAYDVWDKDGRKKVANARFNSLDEALSGYSEFEPFLTPYNHLVDAANTLYDAYHRYESLPQELREHQSLGILRRDVRAQKRKFDELVESGDLVFSPI